MTETVQVKSTGLKFAEQQLLRHGWEKGKGLGRAENGISEAIKVKIKCDKRGMGHKEGEQFTFHWWDHVFNKASSSLVVESGKDNVTVKKADESNDELPVSNKKPRKAQQDKSMLYGCFVKSATLLSGEVHPEKKSSFDDSSSSSSEDEDQKLDLSSTTRLSDTDLLKACGGRTAHKGARHGLTMSAKLARLEQQEQEFLKKYGKKTQTATPETSTSSTVSNTPDSVHEENTNITKKTKHKKSKRKEELSDCDIHNAETKSNGVMENTSTKKKKKKNKKVQPEEGFNGDCNIVENEASTHTTERPHQQRSETEEGASHLLMNDNMSKKRKKRKQPEVFASVEEEVSEDSTDSYSKQPEEGRCENQQTTDNTSKKKKKKKKKSSMEHHEASCSSNVENSTSVLTITEDTSTEAQIIDTEREGQRENRKKKKKRSKTEEMTENVSLEGSQPKKKKIKT